MLDQIHGDLQKPSTDTNTYTLGSIGKHNIVIVCLPKGQYGNNSAANVATNMANTFPSIKFGLMVGIGGGVSPKVRLGDVVVSTPVDTNPGVIQWDIGKSTQDGFKRSGSLNNPPRSLLGAIGKLECTHELYGNKIPHLLEQMQQEWPRLQKYYRSESLEDIRFKADYACVSGPSPHDEENFDDEQRGCQSCDKTKIVNRKPREMLVHYGLIASGNQVIKNAEERVRLNKDLGGNVLCVEMEAAGLMSNFPCIVIRGICDYADSHKNDDWHEHAAASAAAFAKELLSVITPDDLVAETSVKDVLLEVKENVENVQKTINYVIAQKEREKILEWLDPIDYSLQQSDVYSRCQAGTGKWLLKSAEYQTWLENSGQTLFCPGIPGAGKTFQTSILIHDLFDHFTNAPEVVIAYVYLDYLPKASQKTESLLANILKQLARCRKQLPDSVRELHERHHHSRYPPLDELSTTLQDVSLAFARTFIIIDAIDECQDNDGNRQKLLTQLFKLQSSTRANLFVTSTLITEVTKSFEGCLNLDIRPSDEDIASYLDTHMDQLPDFVSNDTHLQKEIKSAIGEAVEGMFLLAQLYLDSLVGKRSPAALRKALKDLRNLSKEFHDRTGLLYDAYKKAMHRILNQREDFPGLAKLALAWIVNAKEPLTAYDLRQALAVKIGSSSLDKDNIPPLDHIVKACAPLVTLEKESNVIRLVHHTTKEYFEKKHEGWFKDAKLEIARISITYISLDSFGEGSHNSMPQNPHFYRYLALNWGHHVREAPVDLQEVLGFLKDTQKAWRTRQYMPNDVFGRGDWPSTKNRSKAGLGTIGLFLAIFFGLDEALKELIANGHDPAKVLLFAAKHGHKNYMKPLLCGNVVNIDPEDKDGMTPLAWCAKKGYKDMLEMLLDGGARMDSRDEYDMTPLAWCARKGHKDMLKILVKRGAQIQLDCQIKHGMTLLAWCKEYGDKDLFTILFNRVPQLDCQNEHVLTLLAWCARKGHKDIFEILLKNGPKTQLDSRDNDGMTPLAWCAREGHKDILEILLKNGPKTQLDSRDNDGMTPLAWCAREGHKDILEILLKNGLKTQLDSRDNDGMTPLAWCAREGHKDILEILLKNGLKTQLDSRDNNGMTPLAWCAREGHKYILEILLKNGPHTQLESKDISGKTPLLWAVSVCRQDVIKLLLDFDADPKCLADFGFTPLCWAWRNDKEKVDSLLPEIGTSVDTKDQTDTNALFHWAIYLGSLDGARLILTWKTAMDFGDLGDGDALHAICSAVGRGANNQKYEIKLLRHYYQGVSHSVQADWEYKTFQDMQTRYPTSSRFLDISEYGPVRTEPIWRRDKLEGSLHAPAFSATLLWRAAVLRDKSMVRELREKGARLGFQTLMLKIDTSKVWEGFSDISGNPELLGVIQEAKIYSPQEQLEYAAEFGYTLLAEILIEGGEVSVTERVICLAERNAGGLWEERSDSMWIPVFEKGFDYQQRVRYEKRRKRNELLDMLYAHRERGTLGQEQSAQV